MRVDDSRLGNGNHRYIETSKIKKLFMRVSLLEIFKGIAPARSCKGVDIHGKQNGNPVHI
jgi:hypothetical protein